jgi:hypothetical protein
MRYLVALTVLAVVLAASAAATAGGWATVELEALPSGVDAGDTWNARFTVLRHGVTPTDGAEPSVTIVDTENLEEITFRASPAGEPGVYEAAVVFRDGGDWQINIDDGLVATGYGVSSTTRFGPVTIADAPAGGPGGGVLRLPFAALGLVLAVALALALVVIFGVRRQRRLAPAGR